MLLLGWRLLPSRQSLVRTGGRICEQRLSMKNACLLRQCLWRRRVMLGGIRERATQAELRAANGMIVIHGLYIIAR
jgi:hypothetical protein